MVVRFTVAVVAASILLCGCGSKESVDPVKERFEKALHRRAERQTAESRDVTVALMENLSVALKMYAVDVGSLPTTAEGLDVLLVAPKSIDDPKIWDGPYLDGNELPKDAWGNPFKFEATTTGYKLISAGANGKFEDGKGDDLVFEGPKP